VRSWIATLPWESSFLGASLQYFPVKEQDPTDQPGDFCVNNELDFSRQMASDVNKWLLNRPVPRGHTRLLHGTARKPMVDIMNNGIDTTNFQSIGDFGPGFYCADDSPSGVLTSVRFAIGSAGYDVDEDAAAVLAAERYGPSRAAVMCFDVPNEDLDNLNPTHLDGEEWEKFTALCLKEDPLVPGHGCYREAFIGEIHHDATILARCKNARHQSHYLSKTSANSILSEMRPGTCSSRTSRR
jgi:hypothetical protein